MKVRDLLRHKGTDVATIDPTGSVTEALGALAEHGIGALVVSTDGRTVAGILSERDIVRRLVADGPSALDLTVAHLMTSNVVTCEPDARVDELMTVMTERRFRHLPVMQDGALAGIISIGDVVNARVNELETATTQLTNYISGY